MATPTFDSDGRDAETFAPFVLINQLDSEWKDVRLSFTNWEWMLETYGESVGDYYLNGYGVQGLVAACRLAADLEPEEDGIDYNSEGDTCYIHFDSLEEAVKTAQLAAKMMKSRSQITAMAKIALENEFDEL